MLASSLVQPLALLCAVAALTPPLGAHIARVMSGRRTFLGPALGPVERLVYRGLRLPPDREQTRRPPASTSTSSPTAEGGAMARSDRSLEIDGEGAFWAVAGFAASLLVGVALRPMRVSAGLENVVVVYVIVVALAAAIGGRMAGLATSLSATLAYNWFFTTPYETLRIDTAEQVATVVLLFLAGLLASLGGRATRRARVEAREEADVLQVLNAVNLAAARGGLEADVVAAEGLRDLLDARAVRVVRDGPEGDLVVAQAGQLDGDLDLDDLPHLDEEGRIPSGHRRSVGGTLVLPAQGTVVDLVRRDRRVGALVIVPAEDRPILRVTRTGIAATAHALANAR